jgi:hypothetical protein
METYGPEHVSERRGQSRMGIASFVLAVLAILCIVVAVVLIVAFGGQITGTDPTSLTPQEMQRNMERSPSATVALGVAGFGVAFGALLFLIGLVLGVAGLIQRRRKKLFAGLGTALNGLPLLLIVGLFVLGAAIGPAV